MQSPITELMEKINNKLRAEYEPRPGTYVDKGPALDKEFFMSNLGHKKFSLLERGAWEALPGYLKEIADQFLGDGAGEQLETDYDRFRASLTDEERAELERELYPAGKWAGMCI